MLVYSEFVYVRPCLISTRPVLISVDVSAFGGTAVWSLVCVVY